MQNGAKQRSGAQIGARKREGTQNGAEKLEGTQNGAKLDMEAGIEHLGRATASAVDKLIVVAEPGRRSIDTAEHIRRLASEIHLQQLFIVGNKVRSPKDEEFLKKHLSDFDILGFIPYADDLIEADLNGESPYDVESTAKARVKEMVTHL